MDVEQEYGWIRVVRDALLSGDLVEPPEAVRQRARALFQAGGQRAGRTLIERVRATLVFDSRAAGLAAAGVRSGAVLDGPWQLLYRGGEFDIDLLVRPNQDGRTMNVRGQALALAGTAIGDGVVEALPTNAYGPLPPAARSELEPSGEFALANLARGRYDVLLRFGAREIELSDLEL